jgi:membrane protease YdiL (CAAX protease family)
MEIKWLQTQSGAARFFITLAVMVCCLCIFMFLGVISGMLLFHLGFNEVLGSASINNPQGVNILKVFQFFQSTGMFVIPPIIMYWLWGEKVSNSLKINTNPKIWGLLLVVFMIIAIIPLINIMAFYNEKMVLPSFLEGIEQWMAKTEESAKQLTTAFLSVNTIGAMFINLLIMAIIPAIGEELFFRGVMQDIFIRWSKNIHLGIFITAFFFSAFHLQFYGFLPRFVLGLIFGYLLVWSGSMWITITAHFINNAMAVLYYYFSQQYSFSNNIEQFGITPDTRIWSVVSAIVLFTALFTFYKISQKNQLKTR